MLLNSSDIAVDVETLGKRNNAAILSIGAVKFDPNGNVLGDAFYVDVDPASCVALGMTIDISTIMWWMGQRRNADGALIYDESRDEARKVMVTADRIDLASALYGFNEWFGPVSLPVWGNGSTFDKIGRAHV